MHGKIVHIPYKKPHNHQINDRMMLLSDSGNLRPMMIIGWNDGKTTLYLRHAWPWGVYL